MSLHRHIRLILCVSVVWGVFWLLGWPDYYQQYSTSHMMIFVVGLFPGLCWVSHGMLRSARTGRKTRSILISVYFTLPFLIYDYLYCGYYLGHGLKYLTIYWYLTIYYVIPWVVVPMTAFRLDSKPEETRA